MIVRGLGTILGRDSGLFEIGLGRDLTDHRRDRSRSMIFLGQIVFLGRSQAERYLSIISIYCICIYGFGLYLGVILIMALEACFDLDSPWEKNTLRVRRPEGSGSKWKWKSSKSKSNWFE